MRQKVFSMPISLLLVLTLPAYAAAAQTPSKLNQIAIEKPAGTFDVFVIKKDQLHQVGTLEYNKYLREKRIDLSGVLPAEENAKWGNPEFTYTDKGDFQHKIYNFAIPLETLSIEQSNFKHFWQRTNKGAGGRR